MGLFVNPEKPWKLPRVPWKVPTFCFRKSKREWQALLARAAEGDLEAQWEVSAVYDEGCKDRAGRIVVRRSLAKGMPWLRKAAEGGHALAQLSLGTILSSKGPRLDLPEALKWLKKAARQIDAFAWFNLAVTYRENDDFRAAVRYFRAAADKDGSALVQVGIHLYWGIGVRKDAVSAVRCFRKASRGETISESERDDTFFYLGVAYAEGSGVRRSIVKARKCFERANADRDHPAAERALKLLVRQA